MTNNSKSLPPEFLRHTEEVFGHDRFSRFLEAFDEEPPVSIRLNPRKSKKQKSQTSILNSQFSPVPWCPDGFYLSERPNFTFDPLFHAGCYYVQEAASQFIVHCTRSILDNGHRLLANGDCSLDNGYCLLDNGHRLLANGDCSLDNGYCLLVNGYCLLVNGYCLDLCAAPGGKSTALRSVLPDDCLLVSNEPIRKRAQILSENIQKWGHPNSLVTNNYPQDFARNGLKETFDLILCDVPCSGEGMFRKDAAAIGEWSPQNVERCWQLQRQIVSDIWPCLRPGGIIIYSTCSFNTKENEENVKWIAEHFDASFINIPTLPDWNICGSLLPGFDAPVYRFIPGLTHSEGLFVAVLRKKGDNEGQGGTKKAKAITSALARLNKMESSPCAKALSIDFDPTQHPVADLSYEQAIAYLRREAIVLPPDTPRGIVVVAYQGQPLGIAKNIGSRANNLYPREWAIKSTHIPLLSAS